MTCKEPLITLSELPIGTVIDDKLKGRFELDVLNGNDQIWTEVYPHCVDCVEAVSANGGDKTKSHPTTDMKAEDYFTDWKVVLVPPYIGEDLLDRINKYNEDKNAHTGNR